MEYIYFCPNCKKIVGSKDTNGKTCPDCNSPALYTGYTNQEWWYNLTREERDKRESELLGNEPSASSSNTTASNSQSIPQYESDTKNGIASLIKVIAWLDFVGWFIIGIVLGRGLYGDFSFFSCLLYWVIGLVSGVMLLGFAEIIQLLHTINQKTK